MNDDNRVIDRAIDNITSLDGYFQIELSDEGVFLTIFPPQDGGTPIREPVIIQDLRHRNIHDYNNALVMRATRDMSGIPVKIAPPPAVLAEPEVQVLVSRDRMEATLQIVSPKGSRQVTMDEVMAKIKNAGIVYGLDHSAINNAYDRPGMRVTCARGLLPINGSDAIIRYHIDMEIKGKPVELEDGRVDYKNLNMFTTVHEGEVLAEKIPPTPGTPGIDILGQQVHPRAGKDLVLPLGKNVRAEGNNIIAALSGQFIPANNKLNIVPVIEVNGDVDLSTGNIDFIGNVIIRGSVQAGFSVKAEGNVEVMGTVSGGIVEGRNVQIRMGVQGMNRGKITATESLLTKFIENATVSAGKDVIVTDVILHSNVSAGKKIVVEGRRGLIAGGKASAGEEIRAKVVGTLLASATDLEVGVNPQLREEYQLVRKDIKKNELSLDQTQKALNILRAMDQSTMPKDKREMLLKLTKAQFHIVGYLEISRNRMLEIELSFEEMKYGRIKIADIVYPGVKIVIGSLVKPIREHLKFVTFFAEEGEIIIGPFK